MIVDTLAPLSETNLRDWSIDRLRDLQTKLQVKHQLVNQALAQKTITTALPSSFVSSLPPSGPLPSVPIAAPPSVPIAAPPSVPITAPPSVPAVGTTIHNSAEKREQQYALGLERGKLMSSTGRGGYTANQLKDFLRYIKQPVSGTKAELVQRLASYFFGG